MSEAVMGGRRPDRRGRQIAVPHERESDDCERPRRPGEPPGTTLPGRPRAAGSGARAPQTRAGGPGAGASSGREPELTIHTTWRHDALARLDALGTGPQQAVLQQVFATVEEAWCHVRPLQLLLEELDRAQPEAPQPLASFIMFAQWDVVDLFRAVAGWCAELVPGPEGWPPEGPDTHSADDFATLFARYLAVLAMAAAHPTVPARLRERVEETARALDDWYPRVETLLGRTEAAWRRERDSGRNAG